MGVLSHGNVRVSLHRDTTDEDVDGLLSVLPAPSLAALALLCVSFTFELHRSNPRTPILLIHVIALLEQLNQLAHGLLRYAGPLRQYCRSRSRCIKQGYDAGKCRGKTFKTSRT